ncbi:hypothetical protein EWM64_g6278 [Hericium alpestre]|uniref:Uncharacterized protein n=1 Tax=Hericium alpestre TaxID=135208 RepID=A0A4Y9ZS89_9AGAM|nr:hypothetical protein EWM64_g6278 [Hericium alpestre]
MLVPSLHPDHNEYVFGGDFEPSSRLLMQFAILRGLCSASDKLHLTSFSILNLLPYNADDGFYGTPLFTRLFLSLQMLHISIITDQSHEGSFPRGPMMPFWDNTIQPRIFNPSAGFALILTSLTLEGDIDIGEFPDFSFAKLNYPRLSSPSLACFMFSEASDLEGFIIRHKATLCYLKLKHCTIPFPEGGRPSRYWAQIWNRFAEELMSLEELVVESKMDTAPGRPLNYAYFDPGWGYNSDYEEVPGDERDAEALAAFDAVVKSAAVHGQA